MKEVVLPLLPPDEIKFEYGHLTGTAYVYDEDFSIRQVDFVVSQPWTQDPFKYNKPTVQEGGMPTEPNDIIFVMDEKNRVGVRPIQLIRQAMRPPAHLYEVDDAILCAILNEKSKRWETRYFPRKCLPEETWQQAMELLGVKDNV
jgi:hypothetical protein